MQFFTRNLNILLVLKFERLMMHYHRLFEKNAFYFLQKMQKSRKSIWPISVQRWVRFRKYFLPK
jgi:hypothetical protein